MDGGDEDDLWLLQALAVMLNASSDKAPGLLSPVPRLITQGGKRFFEKVYESGNPFLFRDHFRLEKRVYDALHNECASLLPNKITYPREVLAVMLDWLGRLVTCRDQETKFGMAYSSVHRYRRVGLYAIIQFLANSITLPTIVPTEFIEKFPCLDQALAAIDGVHVPVMVAVEDSERFRNRKGWTSTNVLIASDWQLNAAFIYPGAEGAAHDSMVLGHSKFRQGLPEHMYVLADAGYALHPQVLTPYRGVRHHLKEFPEGTGRPQTRKEFSTCVMRRHAMSLND